MELQFLESICDWCCEVVFLFFNNHRTNYIGVFKDKPHTQFLFCFNDEKQKSSLKTKEEKKEKQKRKKKIRNPNPKPR